MPGNTIEFISVFLDLTLPWNGATKTVRSKFLLVLSNSAFAASKVALAWASWGLRRAKSVPDPPPTLFHSFEAISDSAFSLSKLTFAFNTFASAVIKASS